MPHINETMRTRYQYYRHQGASIFTAVLSVFFFISAWIFLRPESPGWQWVYAHRAKWFRHIGKPYPKAGDIIRILLQGLWLLIVLPEQEEETNSPFAGRFNRFSRRYHISVFNLSKRLKKSALNHKTSHFYSSAHKYTQRGLVITLSIISISLALICICIPLQPFYQLIFALILAGVALSIRKLPGRLPNMILIILSLTISCRYLLWRYTMTINWDAPLDITWSLLLLFAESFAVLVLFLGYVQTLWPLQRPPISLPPDTNTWPTVDWLITTYNEDLSIVKPSVYAALGVDWPKDKINIYLLDDGNRPAFKEFAEDVGIHYIARPVHDHAKAGNINYALKRTKGDFVAIFDCDHVATHTFLQLTMGWFLKDPKLAILQTPHHFFSADPFERNLKNFRSVPNEGLLFYGLIQDGNDTWNATFFCGSCGILRRSALEKIGGMAEETVTEDAHTSLRLQREGYTSAYIRIPLAAGMATENLSSHIGQRIRWARGMAQIFRIDNPLLGKGLNLVQRLCYTNSIMHFLSGFPRLIFLTAPLGFLLFHAYIIYAPALIILIYALPHLFHAMLTNSNMQGKFRLFFWGEFYETVLAWYITWPTTVTLFNPYKGTFNVTDKGSTTENQHVDWLIARPYLILLGLNLLGAIYGIWRIFDGPSNEVTTVFINLFWVAYNVIILSGALAVVVEAKQVRKSYRIDTTLPAAIARSDGHLFPCTLRDYSDGSVGVEMLEPNLIKDNDEIHLLLKRGTQEYSFPCKVTRSFNRLVGMRLDNISNNKHIEFIQCTFARADAWAGWQENLSGLKPWKNIKNIIQFGANAYVSMMDHTSPKIRAGLLNLKTISSWIGSFMPHNIKKI